MRSEYIELYKKAMRKYDQYVDFEKPIEEIKKLIHFRGVQLDVDKNVIYSLLKNFNEHTGTSFVKIKDPGGEAVFNDYLTTEEGQESAMRYLLVNGLIPPTGENLKEIKEVVIDAKNLDSDQMEEAKKLMEEQEGVYYEQTDCEILEETDEQIQYVRYKNGRITQVSTIKHNKCAVSDRFDYQIEEDVK